MSLGFLTTSINRDLDAPDGFLYQARTALDFHQGWYTTLRRTKRMESGFPPWSHGLVTHSLIESGEWVPAHQCRPVMKFDTFELAEAWLEDYLSRPSAPPPLDPEIEKKAREAYTNFCDNHPAIHSNRFPSWEELREEARDEWRKRVA